MPNQWIWAGDVVIGGTTSALTVNGSPVFPQGYFTLDVSGGGPFTLTATQNASFSLYNFSGTPGAPVTVIWNDVARGPFVVQNTSDSDIIVQAGAGSFVTVPSGSTASVWTDGLTNAFIAVSVVPAGVNTSVQFNNSGAFGGDSNFTWDTTARVLTVNGAMAGNRTIDTSVSPFYQFQNFIYTLANTTGTIGDSGTGRNFTARYLSSSGGTGASIAGDSISVRADGTDIVDSVTGSNIFVENTGGGHTNFLTGLNVLAVDDQGSVSNLVGIDNRINLSAGSPSVTNATGISISSSLGGGGFSSIQHLVGLDIKPFTFPATSSVPLTEGVLIEDQGIGIPINNNPAVANAIHVKIQTVGSNAILVDGGLSIFGDTLIANGGSATNVVTKTAAYTATSKDVTILGNGTFTVSLAPFTFSLTNATFGGATTTYTGTITGGGSNAYAGARFTIAGFANVHNNGTFICSSSTSTTLVLINPNGTTEAAAATAAVTIVSGQLYRIKNINTGVITVASSANIDGLGTAPLTQNQSIDVQWDGSTWRVIGQPDIQSLRFSVGTVLAGAFSGPFTINFSAPFVDNNYTVEATVVVGEALSTAPCIVAGVQQNGGGTGVDVWVVNNDTINHTVFVNVVARHD